MNKSLLITIFFMLLGLVPLESAHAAIKKDGTAGRPGVGWQAGQEAGISSKKEKKGRGKLAKLKKKLAKKMEKLKRASALGEVSTYLLLSLALLLAAILFFALNGSMGVFNVFGSLAAIGAAVFFVLWLFEITGRVN